MPRHRVSFLLAAILLLLGAPAQAVAQEAATGTPTAAPTVDAGPPDAVVGAGDSIQAAVDAARPGDIIHVEPGTYAEAIFVETAQLTLIGLSDEDGQGVVVKNPGAEINGIEVTGTGDGFVLSGVTVRGFDHNGVLVYDLDGFRLVDVVAEDNGEYGLYAVRSRGGVIERSMASGHADSGIYVGLSEEIEVRQSVAFENVTGILIENVANVRVVDNDTHGNRSGIGLILIPGLAWTTSSDVVVAGNRVHDNNHPAFPTADELSAAVPSGIGILVLGTDRVTVAENRVTGNNFVGIGVGSMLLLAMLARFPADAFAGIDANSDDVRVETNDLSGNGSTASVPLLPPGDLLWDGSGSDNCWQDNVFSTSVPAELPPCDGTAG